MTPPSPPLRFPALQLSGPELSERARLPPGQSEQGSLPSHGFVPLDSVFPRIGITKQNIRKLEAIQMVRDQRENRKQTIAYHARPFVLCGLPLRKPAANQVIYTRRNGNFLLEITAHPRFGLPYGQDRLIPIWLATLALRQRNRVVRFESPAQLLDYFRLRKDGSQYRRMKRAFQRVFAATIFFGSEDHLKKHLVIDWSRFHFVDQMQLWFNRDDQPQPSLQEGPHNVVVLSEGILSRDLRAPDSRGARGRRRPGACPGPLGFLCLDHMEKLDGQKPAAHVPVFGLNGLCNQLGTKQYSVERLFRHKVRQWIAQVQKFWPDCPASISADGLCVSICSSKTSSAVRPADMAADA